MRTHKFLCAVYWLKMERSAQFCGQFCREALIASSFFEHHSVIATTILTFPKGLKTPFCPLAKFYAIPDKKSVTDRSTSSNNYAISATGFNTGPRLSCPHSGTRWFTRPTHGPSLAPKLFTPRPAHGPSLAPKLSTPRPARGLSPRLSCLHLAPPKPPIEFSEMAIVLDLSAESPLHARKRSQRNKEAVAISVFTLCATTSIFYHGYDFSVNP